MGRLTKIDRLYDKLDRSKTNHILHLLLTVFTGGIWAFMWLSVTIANAVSRYRANRALDKIYKRGRVHG